MNTKLKRTLLAMSALALAAGLAVQSMRVRALSRRPQVVLYRAPESSAAGTSGAVSAPPDDGCIWGFDSYRPSAWEQEWRAGLESGERRDQECEVLARPEEVTRSVQLLTAVIGAMAGQPVPAESIPLFSTMVYAQRCGTPLTDTGKRRAQLIEPLVGLLRDPLTMCPRAPGIPDDLYTRFGVAESHLQSKRHFLLRPAAPWSDQPDDPKSYRAEAFAPTILERVGNGSDQRIVMDIGASLFDGWKGNSSAAGALWFVDRLAKRGLAVNSIVSFELNKHDPDDIYRAVPNELLPRYYYFNQPVDSTAGGRWNPWRFLTAMGIGRRDYVVVKLDIDAPPIESELVRQVADDRAVTALIDEMFFEHHVNVKAMWPWWHTQGEKATMKDTYRIFTDLRTKGVRMHAWP